MKGLTDIPGILVGHASDYGREYGQGALCGPIAQSAGAVAGGEIRGFATGTGEWDLLSPYHVTEKIRRSGFRRRQRVRPGSRVGCSAFFGS